MSNCLYHDNLGIIHPHVHTEVVSVVEARIKSIVQLNMKKNDNYAFGELANNPVVMFCLNNIKKTDRLPVLSMTLHVILCW